MILHAIGALSSLFAAPLRAPAPRASVQATHVHLEAIEDGIVYLRGGGQRAVLEITGAHFGMQGLQDQEAALAGFAAFLDGLDVPLQILARVLPADLDRRASPFEQAARSYAPGPLAELAVDHGLFLRRLARTRTLLERRFYVIVPAPHMAGPAHRSRKTTTPAGNTPAQREEARRQLVARCDAIARSLARCDLTVRRLDTAALADLFYGCWNAGPARGRPLPQPLDGYATPLVRGPMCRRPADETRTFSTGVPLQGGGAASPAAGWDGRDDALRWSLGQRSVADLIAPAAVEVQPGYLRLGDEYARTLKLIDYPRTVTAGWLEPLLALGEPLDLSLHIHPLESHTVVRTLSHKLAQFQSSRLLEARDGRLADPQREVAFEDAERLRDALQRGEERIFSVGCYVLLRARSPEALDALTRQVELSLAGMRARAHPALFEQDRGFGACLPQAQDGLLAVRNLDTSSLATMFPFSSASPSTAGGVLWGVATGSQAPVFLDPFDPTLENANQVIFARSGAGKSFATKLLALRQLLCGVDVLIIDPEDEYRQLCEASGGQYIRLSSASGHRLNPFDLPLPSMASLAVHATGDNERGALAEQVTALLALCELMLAEPGARLGTHERAILDSALYATYAQAGITADAATHGRIPPTMADLLAVLSDASTPVAAGLAQRLRRYVDGSLAGLFAGPTNVALDRSLTVFNVQALEAELRAVAIHLITTFIWNQVRRVQRPRLLIVDEAWSLLQHAESGAFLAALARRARKYHLGLVCISQDVADFLGAEHGRTVLANAATKLLLKQDGSAVEPVVTALGLSPRERQFLLGAGRGEGLLLSRGARVPLTVVASEREYRLATTAPQDVQQLPASREQDGGNQEAVTGSRGGSEAAVRSLTGDDLSRALLRTTGRNA